MMPSLFISHGAPTFAIEPGQAGPQLRALGEQLPRPRGIVVVSPHWMTAGLEISSTAQPETLHDFGGFPRELYSLQYAAPGSPELAERVQQVLQQSGLPARLNPRRGLDHGAWVPLLHLYPEAQIPVLQLSLPLQADETLAWALGQALGPLASEGLLIIGSGSLTHNLYEVRLGADEAAPYAAEFSAWVRQTLLQGDADRLLQTLKRAPHAERAHPTAGHLLPLFVAAGAASWPTAVTVIEGGICHGVLAMDSFVFGPH